MNNFLSMLVAIVGCLGGVLGMFIACADVSNKEMLLPRDFYDDGYNWVGSWIIFIIRFICALPFYIIFVMFMVIHKFIKWLFTLGRKEK